MKFYVTMTDGFMSGWGHAEGKINKLVMECDGIVEAGIVRDNADARSEMKYVNICSSKPSYPAHSHLTQFKTKEDYPRWYQEGAFS